MLLLTAAPSAAAVGQPAEHSPALGLLPDSVQRISGIGAKALGAILIPLLVPVAIIALHSIVRIVQRAFAPHAGTVLLELGLPLLLRELGGRALLGD